MPDTMKPLSDREEFGLCAGCDKERVHVLDMHCDTLDRLALHGDSSYSELLEHDYEIPHERMSSLANNDAHFSLDRVSHLAWCQCFAVFVPDPLRGDEAWKVFTTVHGWFEKQLELYPDRIVQIRDARDIDGVLADRRVAAMLTVENGSFLDGSLEHVADMADAGVKMMTLTWNGPTAIGSGHDTDGGLTMFGKTAVRALERERIVADVSHLNDRGFDDFIEVATRPFAASHSNARSICGHRRNLDDGRFRAICDARGVVGLNFCNHFISEDSDDPTIDDLLRHVDRFLELGGQDAIALGSDFDGCDPPSWLVGADRVEHLFNLFDHEFGAAIARKICFENARDFFVRNEIL